MTPAPNNPNKDGEIPVENVPHDAHETELSLDEAARLHGLSFYGGAFADNHKLMQDMPYHFIAAIDWYKSTSKQ